MRLLKTHVLTIIFFISWTSALSQQGIWINEYSMDSNNKQKSNEFSNRLMLKITLDSIYTFDPAKEEWRGYFQKGFLYTKKESKLWIEEIGIELQSLNENSIVLRNNNYLHYFKKVKPQKGAEKFRKLISENIFKGNLNNTTEDTISFRIDIRSPEYEFTNVGVYLMKLNKSGFLLIAVFDRPRVYEVGYYNKKGFSIINNSMNGSSKINFTVIELKEIENYLVKD